MNWRDRSGMTLLELLVALVLVAVIAAGLAASTSLGVQVLTRTEVLDDTNPQIALRTRLRQWMRTATPPSRLAGFETGLTGDASGLSMTTLSPALFAPDSAAVQINLFVAEDVFRMHVTSLDDDGAPLETHERVLAEGLTNLTISYYSDDPTNPGWRAGWDDPNRLPRLVRVTADAGSTPAWPEFTVRLALAQPR